MHSPNESDLDAVERLALRRTAAALDTVEADEVGEHDLVTRDPTGRLALVHMVLLDESRRSDAPLNPAVRMHVHVDPLTLSEQPDADLQLGLEVLAFRSSDGCPSKWWIEDAQRGSVRGLSGRLKLTETRRLLQMVCPLPVASEEPRRATRSFDPHDAEEWLRVNNAAFDWHPDQGGQTRQSLDTLLSRPWIRPDGLLVLDADTATAPDTEMGPDTEMESPGLAGFCFTRLHDAHDPPLGEIYVIAVAPEHTGRGLGKALTLAGLNVLHRQGAALGMLYVEADNESALATYRRLGFADRRHNSEFAIPATAARLSAEPAEDDTGSPQPHAEAP